MTTITFSNTAVPTAGVSYTYDPVSPRVVTMTDGTGVTTYNYHPAGQLGAGQVPFDVAQGTPSGRRGGASVDGPLGDDTIAYTYDALGRVETRAIHGVPLTLTYDPSTALGVALSLPKGDALGRVTQEGNALGTFGYAYDGTSGRVATVTYPNGQTSAYTYLPAAQDHRLQTIHHRLANTTTVSRFDPSTALGVALSLSKGDYTYDAVGNLVTWQQQAGTAAPARWTYGYDRADQLTRAQQATTDPTPTVLQRFAYGYDPAGNRLFEQIDDGVTAWTHDRLNRLQTQAGGGILQVAGTVNEPAAFDAAQAAPSAVEGRR